MPLKNQKAFANQLVPGIISRAVRAFRTKNFFFLLSVIIYIVSFIILYKWKNYGMGAVAIIPVITAAWVYGTAAGCAAGLLSLAANIAMGQIIGIDWYMRIIKTGTGIVGASSLIVLGFVVGRISDFSRRLKKELNEKELLKHTLEINQLSLEKLVREKTVSLSAALEELQASNNELETSEKRLRAVFETAIDAIVTTSSEGKIHNWNQAAEKIYGYSAAEVLGRHVNMLIPERFHTSDHNGMKTAIQEGTEQNFYNRVEGIGLKKDGSEFPTEVSLSIWKSGVEVFATGIIRDITERKISEKVLLEREARLRSVVETAIDAIITVNSTGLIIDWNQAAEKIYGYTASEIIGKPANTIIPERIHPRDSQQMTAAVQQGEERVILNRREGLGIRKDGAEFPTEVSQSIWKSGGEVFATGIVRDITERKNAEKALLEREERLRAIVETAVDGIITADSTGIIVFWNHAAEKIYGYTAGEIVGKNINQLLPERLHTIEIEGFTSALQNKSMQMNVESIGLRKDGSEFAVEVTRAVWSSEGATFATAIVRDITERKNAERDRMLLSSVIEQAHENILIMDAKGTILYVNPAIVSLMNRPMDEILGKNGFQASGSIYDTQSFKTIYEQLQGGSAWTGVLNYQIRDGKIASIEQTLSPVLDADGRLTNILSISRDISHEKYLEEQLRQSQKMEAIGTLAGGIAHDFNNILAAILGYSELAMMDVPKDSITAGRLHHVISSCDRARSLVKQILTFSRKSQQEARPFRISSIIKEVIKLLRASLPSTIEIRQDIRDTDAVVRADPTQLHQLIINLCTNSAQAMEESGGILTISQQVCIRTTDNMAGCYDLPPGAYVQLTVQDTGPGIAPDIKERIFEPFFTTKAVGKGTGMGLAVAHGIVKSYDGCIHVDSEPGTGAAFHVLLPRIDEEPPEAAAHQPAEIPRGSGTILFVDDEETVMQIGQNMLESLGYTVFSASSSTKAIELFSDDPGLFDCVVTDMTMPHIRGDELAIRLLALRPELPIILCTGFSEKISEEQALEMGIRAFLSKPFSMQDLGLALQKALDGRL
jgi:PAS domain S-box-containing protein